MVRKNQKPTEGEHARKGCPLYFSPGARNPHRHDPTKEDKQCDVTERTCLTLVWRCGVAKMWRCGAAIRTHLGCLGEGSRRQSRQDAVAWLHATRPLPSSSRSLPLLPIIDVSLSSSLLRFEGHGVLDIRWAPRPLLIGRGKFAAAHTKLSCPAATFIRSHIDFSLHHCVCVMIPVGHGV